MSWEISPSSTYYLGMQLHFSLNKQLQCFLMFSLVKLCSILTCTLTWEGQFGWLAVGVPVLIWVCANWREDLLHKWEICHWSQLVYVWHHSLSAWVMKALRLKITTCRDCSQITLIYGTYESCMHHPVENIWQMKWLAHAHSDFYFEKQLIRDRKVYVSLP